MLKTWFQLLFLALCVAACSPEKDPDPGPDPVDPTPPVVDEKYFKAFSANDPHNEVLFDTLANLLYLVERPSGGKIFAYNYQTREVVATTTKPTLTLDYPMALGRYQGAGELYLGNGGSVYVYDGNSLDFKDSIQVFVPGAGTAWAISSIEFQSPNLLFVGLCDQNGTVLVYNRDTRQVISNTWAGNCVRLRTYKDNGQIGVISISYAGSPLLALGKFAADGTLLDHQINFNPSATTSLHLLKTTDQADFFITSDESNVFRKSDLSYVKAVAPNRQFKDLAFSPQTDTLYGFSGYRTAEVTALATGTLVRSTNLPETPQRAVWDESLGNWVIVYFVYPPQPQAGQPYLRNIYLSKMKI